MKTFRVYFIDGKQELFEGEDMVSVMNYLLYNLGCFAGTIVRIENALYF